jgi:hypothetical protein
MKWILVLLFGMAAFECYGQGRDIDLKITISDPKSGDSFVSPSKRLITVFLHNNGPDTIIPKDEFYVEFIFSAFHIFPKFVSFGKVVLPGDSFMYQRELDIKYSGDVSSMKFCAEAYAYSLGRDSIQSEKVPYLKNNKDCILTRHIDSNDYSNTNFREEEANFICYPNPAQNTFTVSSKSQIISASLFDINGKNLIHVTPSSDDTAQFTITGYPPGLYFITVRTELGTYNQKIIKGL